MQGRKKHTNKLINETSPYLLQHAHNPVNWYPWGEEAFERARNEDKPVLVSIGYSACHWCHVMERESFEDEETAALMNEHFVNIKVDMEERPDVDKIYMSYVQMTTGSGGWPMNVFLSPDKRPFFGGTYFPPENRYNMPSFKRVLASIADVWVTKRDELLFSANEVIGEMRRMSIAEMPGEGLSTAQLENAFQHFVRYFDAKNGGFGGAPKFPPAMSLEFLLRFYKRTGNENALEIVRHTCLKMAHGGIYDQLGGGFHRYAVDSIWLVPHFEKMLYDNAQIALVYLHLFQATKDEFYKRIAVETLDYVTREMNDGGGGFYSTQDADSEGVEGKFFVWTPSEIEAILGKDDARLFCFYYDVSEEGNFEEKNILNVRHTLAETAEALDVSADRLTEALETGREALFREREKRIKPFRDEKIITAWNGLMLSAFAEAAAILGRADYLETARRNADFLMRELVLDGRVLRTWKDSRAKLGAYLEDYANLGCGLLDLFQACGDMKYFVEARRLADVLITSFWDEADGGFFFTANDHEELIVRTKDYFDNTTPAGNSAAADLLLKIAAISGDERYERFAVTVLRLVSSQIKRYPSGFGRALSALEFHLGQRKEIVLVGESEELRSVIWNEFLPTKVVIPVGGNASSETIPLLDGKSMIDGKPAAYVCVNFACRRPVTNAADLAGELTA
ncbi:MAG: thioredoxin domain-containing protein [Acidobacteria bacterium]|nr:thioredoxin domain-containing protein [Acidobacteriota bacterium]